MTEGTLRQGDVRSEERAGGGGVEPVAGAVNDFKLLRSTIDALTIARPASGESAHGVCLDKGYDYPEVYELLAEFGFTADVRARGEEAQAIKREAGFRARRWVVERTHSWLNRFRRLLIRWEKRADTYLAMLHLACGLITWRATRKARQDGLPG